MNIWKQNYQLLVAELKSIYSQQEAEIISEWLLSYFDPQWKLKRITDSAPFLTTDQQTQLKEFKRELLAHRPIQYVLGTCPFFGLDLVVDERVLIPRPETEELVDWVLKTTPSNSTLKILDIGTGSGCIALTLKKHLPHAEIHALDYSTEALQLAKENANTHQLKIHFHHFNILTPTDFFPISSFDYIISNPPYIDWEEKNEMDEHVKDYEPHLALFAPKGDPQAFYKAIATFAKQHLTQNGKLFFELHALGANETERILKTKGWKTQLKQDLQGRNRMLMAEK